LASTSPAISAITDATHTIDAVVPNGTDVSALVASFTTTGVSVTVGGTPQVSGATALNFINPVTYRVTAFDGSTQDYVVTVAVAAAAPAPAPPAPPAPTPTPTPTPTPAPTLTLKLTGLKSGSIKLGKSVTAKGVVTPASLAGGKVALKAQLKKGAKWVKAKAFSALITSTGAYSWKYKPAKKGSYRVQAVIAGTAAHAAATTKWLVQGEVAHASSGARRGPPPATRPAGVLVVDGPNLSQRLSRPAGALVALTAVPSSVTGDAETILRWFTGAAGMNRSYAHSEETPHRRRDARTRLPRRVHLRQGARPSDVELVCPKSGGPVRASPV